LCSSSRLDGGDVLESGDSYMTGHYVHPSACAAWEVLSRNIHPILRLKRPTYSGFSLHGSGIDDVPDFGDTDSDRSGYCTSYFGMDVRDAPFLCNS
jgi:hypothetical protein